MADEDVGTGTTRWAAGRLRIAGVVLLVTLAMATGTRAQTAGPPATPGTIQGHLGPGGRVANYPIFYPGDKSVYTIDVTVSPGSVGIPDRAGFKLYGPQKGTVYLTGGAQVGLDPNVSGNLVGIDAGTYTVQIFNYSPDVAIDYELSLVAGPIPGEDQNKTS